MVTPILTTKLHIPSQRRNLVPRTRLLQRLDRALRSKLTLISAPAGFGKTTLLADWIHSLQTGDSPPVKVAWISLDDGDNDPARFSAYLDAAFHQADSSFGQPTSDPFEVAGTFLQESHLVNLINQIVPSSHSFLLVLDDYHLITSQHIHNAVAFLIDHLSDNLHLVLATRGDPPLSLPRLRARGQLTELRQGDLRFTANEAAAFLNSIMGLDLSTQHIAALEARTEGWIAGLQMAALSLQGLSLDPMPRSEFIRAFTGSHRFVLDYLVEEVLDQQPTALQEFLLRTSILKQLTGPLCDQVVGDRGIKDPTVPPDSQSILEHLEAANLFIVPLDHQRHWYRYHRLFSDLLRRRLQQTSPNLVPELHRRASAWHQQQGLMAQAIDHSLAAQDFGRAATLIENNVEATFMRSEVTTFLNWMARLPDEWVRNSPSLCFFHAWALLMSGSSPDLVEQRLQDIACFQGDPEIAGPITGRVAALRAYRLLFDADIRGSARYCQQALEHLPESDLFLRSIVTWILSLARLSDGDLQDGKRALQEVVSLGQKVGNPLISVTALCHQARLLARQGRLHLAREILDQALQLATDPNGQRLPIASEALIGLGDLEREWNNLEQATEHLTESIVLSKQWSELASFDAYNPLARVRFAQGDVEGARKALKTAQQLAHRFKSSQLDDLVADLQLAHFAATQGDLTAARRWAQKQGLLPGDSPQPRPDHEHLQDFVIAHLRKYQHLVLARIHLLQGQNAEALDLLDSLLAHAQDLGRIDLSIETQLLRALAFQASGQDAQAITALSEALTLAEPGGWVRIFLDEGKPMVKLLRQAAPRDTTTAYVTKLLAAWDAPESTQPSLPAAQSLIEPLSQRELEVLRLLTTGMSNPEIATELVIAVSTVRSHCKSIYAKLGVHSRWDAVHQAQELGLTTT